MVCHQLLVIVQTMRKSLVLKECTLWTIKFCACRSTDSTHLHGTRGTKRRALLNLSMQCCFDLFVCMPNDGCEGTGIIRSTCSNTADALDTFRVLGGERFTWSPRSNVVNCDRQRQRKGRFPGLQPGNFARGTFQQAPKLTVLVAIYIICVGAFNSVKDNRLASNGLESSHRRVDTTREKGLSLSKNLDRRIESG